MDARVLLQGHARLGSWMAIEVHLQNDGPSVVGELRLQGGSQGGTRYAVPVDLASPSDKRWILYAQPPRVRAARSRSCSSAATRRIASKKVAFTVHDANQLIVGVVAEQPAGIVVRDLSLPAVQNKRAAVVVPLDVADLPEPARGLVVARPPRLAGRRLQPALEAAARRAPRLARARRPPDRRRRDDRARRPRRASPTTSSPTGPTSTVDVAPASLSRAPRPSSRTTRPTSRRWPASSPSGRALATSGDRVVAADASYGSGSRHGHRRRPDRRLDRRVEGDRRPLAEPDPGPVERVRSRSGDDSQIVGAVSDLPALALPPVGGLVLLLFGYIALIGPINYFVLKRLDRREWAWVTMPVLIVVFAVGAYVFGSALRGSDVIVNEVAIVRGAPDATEGIGPGLPRRLLADARHVPGLACRAARCCRRRSTATSSAARARPSTSSRATPSQVRDLAVGFGSLRTSAPRPRPTCR